jgi:hypothetical protein
VAVFCQPDCARKTKGEKNKTPKKTRVCKIMPRHCFTPHPPADRMPCGIDHPLTETKKLWERDSQDELKKRERMTGVSGHQSNRVPIEMRPRTAAFKVQLDNHRTITGQVQETITSEGQSQNYHGTITADNHSRQSQDNHTRRNWLACSNEVSEQKDEVPDFMCRIHLLN